MTIPQRLRPLAKRPALCAGVVVVLGLAVGMNAAMFGLVRATVFLPRQSFDSSQLFAVSLRYTPPAGDRTRRPKTSMTVAKIEELIQSPPAPLVSVIARHVTDVVVRFGNRAERLNAEFLLGDYERSLRLRPGTGRFLDASTTSADTVVVSDRLWREWFAGATPGSVKLRVDGRWYTVVGAAPTGFRGVIQYQPVEIWLPASALLAEKPGGRNLLGGLQLFFRAPPGVSARTAAGVVSGALARGINPVSPDEFAVSAMAVDSLVADSLVRVGWITLGFGVLVLVAGAVNSLNLLHVFFAARSREFATRRALGATASSLTATCVAEIAFLLASASVVAISVAWGVLAAINRGAPLGLASSRPFSWRSGATYSVIADRAVIAYALLSILVAGCLLAAAAVTRVLRVSAANRLIGESAKSGRFGARQLMLSLQVAIATILMLSTATFIGRVMPALDQRPAINTAGVASARIDLSLHGYSDVAGREFYARLLAVASGIPGIGAVALTDGIPGYSYVSHPSFQIVAEPTPDALSNAARKVVNGSYAGVSEKFFDVMSLRVLEGRGVVAADGYGAPLVVVVSQSVATRLWPGNVAIGKRIMFGAEGQWRTVVGVSEDPIRVRSDTGAVCRSCVVFVPFQQRYNSLMVMVVRADSAAHGAELLGRTISRQSADVVPFDLGALDSTLLSVLWRERSAMMLVATVGIVALLIAAAGIFSATAYIVDVRAFEMAVRMALGATPRRVVGLVLNDVRLVTLVGLLVGVTVMSLGERGLAALIRGFMPNDLWTWAIVLITVPLVTIGAGYLPARRSARVAPAKLLSRGDS
ncbi:MAG: FtsX-like permease family protein [Acidobacteria bacterium]|nr:MAG: FtsX-like permease family protein [Acidobacteriota bacterium]